ncbi:MAG: gliding motility-associated C-terminal domain-containing protein [Bacteroidota bacterium]
MKRYQTYFYRGIITLFALGMIMQNAGAQISAPQSDYQTTLPYTSATAPDPLFVFYRDEGNSTTASLTAHPPTPSSCTFEWSKYNPGTASWVLFQSDTDLATSTAGNLSDGGYRVHISNGSDIDTVFTAWVMLDHLLVEVDKTSEGKTPRYNYSCDFLILSGTITPETWYYYDPVNHDQLLLENGYRFEWTSDNSDNRIYNATTVLTPNTTYNPPVKDTRYVLTATDSLGMVVDDSVLYETINTKASFRVEYLDKETDPPAFSTSPGLMDAPLTVRFINESENGAEFEWVFVDTATAADKLLEYTYSLDASPEFIYYHADDYYTPYLVSRSDDPLSLEGCIDTFRLEEAIYVLPSQLNIPNVFTPNGDGMNDYFIFKHQSLKKCNLTIVDRFGKVVYRVKIDDIYTWDGWNGKVLNSDRDAPEGPYFFVIDALGYDDVEYKDLNIIEQWKQNRQNPTGTGTTGGTETPSNNKYTGWVYLFRYSGEF